MDVILKGHLSEIEDIKVFNMQYSLVLTSGKDESIRLWNIYTHICIAIFAGAKGHRDYILSIDIHPMDNCFVSCGQDSRYTGILCIYNMCVCIYLCIVII